MMPSGASRSPGPLQRPPAAPALPVVHRFSLAPQRRSPSRAAVGWIIAVLAVLFAALAIRSFVRDGGDRAGMIAALARWSPLMFWGPPGQIGGFVLNVLVSAVSMALG